MNFTKYFKRKDYDHSDRFMLQHKFRSCRDPFEGDPFKIQSLNFRYADKPIFYPICNRSKLLMQNNMCCNQPKHRYSFEKENTSIDKSKQSALLKNARKSSSVYSFSSASKTVKLASNTPTEPTMNSFQREVNSVINKSDFNRSRSFIHRPTSVTEEAALPSQTVLRKNLFKATKSNGTKKRRDSITAINVDHSDHSGCKITIKINGLPSDQVHINENVKNLDYSQNRTKSIANSSTPKISAPYELRPSRSYVISRDDTAAGNRDEQRKSPRKLLRECSTHSMIPHKEEKITSNEFGKVPSKADIACSSFNFKSGVWDNKQLNLSRKVSRNCLGKGSQNSPLKQRACGINLVKQASMCEQIISRNPIFVPSRENILLMKSKSGIDQRFTPLPIPGKYTFEHNTSRTR